jgi:hypothetical protein
MMPTVSGEALSDSSVEQGLDHDQEGSDRPRRRSAHERAKHVAPTSRAAQNP